MSDLADKLETLAGKATKGPWYTLDPPWLPSGCETSILAESPDPHVARFLCDFDFAALDEEDRKNENPDEDAALIVALRNNLPAIIAALRAQEARPEPSADLVEIAGQAVHSYCSRNMIMTYLDADEDCTGVGRAVLTAIGPALEAKGAAQRQAEIVAWLRTTNYCCAMGDTIADDLEAQEPGKA